MKKWNEQKPQHMTLSEAVDYLGGNHCVWLCNNWRLIDSKARDTWHSNQLQSSKAYRIIEAEGLERIKEELRTMPIELPPIDTYFT